MVVSVEPMSTEAIRPSSESGPKFVSICSYIVSEPLPETGLSRGERKHSARNSAELGDRLKAGGERRERARAARIPTPSTRPVSTAAVSRRC